MQAFFFRTLAPEMLAQKHGWPGPCHLLVRGQQLWAGFFCPQLIHGVEHTDRFVLLPFFCELSTIFFSYLFLGYMLSFFYVG